MAKRAAGVEAPPCDSVAFGPNFKRMKFVEERTNSNILERVSDTHVLAQRQKQIDFGKNTLAYDRYSTEVKRRERTEKDPQTPDASEPISKRRFDGKVKAWRRSLHVWEDTHPPQQADSVTHEKSEAHAVGGSTSSAPTGTSVGLSSCADNFDDFLENHLDDDEEDEPEAVVATTEAVGTRTTAGIDSISDPGSLRKRLDEFKQQPTTQQSAELLLSTHQTSGPAVPGSAHGAGRIFGTFEDDLLG